jgi:hypothetical protein
LRSQEGYTLDLLSEPHRSAASPAPPQGASSAAIPTGAGAVQSARAATPHSLASDPEAGFSKERNGTGTTSASLRGAGYKGTSRIPWWRTTKGITGLAIAAVVILAVVIGASVGVTQHNKHKNNSLIGSTPTSSEVGGPAVASSTVEGGVSQGVGGAPSTTVVAGGGGENGGTTALSSSRTRGGVQTQEPFPTATPAPPPGTGDGGTQGVSGVISGVANAVPAYGADQAA